MNDETASTAADDQREIASHLNSGAIHLLRGLRETDRASGLTPARLSALSVVVFGGPLPLGHLARAEWVTGPTMTRIVDGLCMAGLVRRAAHPHNARTTMIHATEAGEDLMREAAERRFAAIGQAMAGLDAEDRRALAAAAPALRRLAAGVRKQANAE